MIGSILVVDDSPPVRDLLRRALSSEGYRVAAVGSGEEALSRIADHEFDVVLADLVLPGVSGLDVLDRSRRLRPRAAVILMTGHATLESAIAALRRGASDYLVKPFTLDALSLRVRHLVEGRAPSGPALAPTGAAAVERLEAIRTEPVLIGESAAMHTVREQIAKVAGRPSTVLITGESGVGKEMVARAVHAASGRRDGPFVAVNCGAIPESLLESQLFGHVRGAFTSAVQANRGLFMAAAGGTLLLDEIGEMPLPLQVKLLRVLEERHVWPVGSTKLVAVDVRIVASTNRDLVREVAAGRFREDLFYRLNVVRVEVPPLRERRDDIPPLVGHLVERLNARLGTRFLGVEPDALAALAEHPWRGNVRELENALERGMVLGSGELISLSDLSDDLAPSQPFPRRDLREAVRQFERRHVSAVLAEAHLDKKKAAHVLGISLASLYRKLGAEGTGDVESEPSDTGPE